MILTNLFLILEGSAGLMSILGRFLNVLFHNLAMFPCLFVCLFKCNSLLFGLKLNVNSDISVNISTAVSFDISQGKY